VLCRTRKARQRFGLDLQRGRPGSGSLQSDRQQILRQWDLVRIGEPSRGGSFLTAIIHTLDAHLAERYGLETPASGILINSPGSHGCCGTSTGLIPSATLGCGTVGGSPTSENVTYTHLRDIKRVAYAL
jgi:hypothetical protein